MPENSGNPQLEDGYVRIANELWDALTAIRIPGEAHQVLDVIIRKTYGFNKKWDRISLSQFSKLTGLKKSHVVRSIAKLQDMNVIIKEGNKNGASYCLNKHYGTWEPLPKRVTNYIKKPLLKPFCYLCGYKESLHKHHITPRSQGGANTCSNKIHLCPNCHALVHKGRYKKEELLSIKITVESITKKDNGSLPEVKKPLPEKVPTKDTLTKDTSTKHTIVREKKVSTKRKRPEVVFSEYWTGERQREALNRFVRNRTFSEGLIREGIQKCQERLSAEPDNFKLTSPYQFLIRWLEIEVRRQKAKGDGMGLSVDQERDHYASHGGGQRGTGFKRIDEV